MSKRPAGIMYLGGIDHDEREVRMYSLDGTDIVFDSLDVIERIADLRESLSEKPDDEDAEDIRVELADLEKFVEDAKDVFPDFEHGETFIRDSYFEEYAQELAEDIGAISGDMQWPLCHIDWASAADELKMDYCLVEFMGVDYWARG